MHYKNSTIMTVESKCTTSEERASIVILCLMLFIRFMHVSKDVYMDEWEYEAMIKETQSIKLMLTLVIMLDEEIAGHVPFRSMWQFLQRDVGFVVVTGGRGNWEAVYGILQVWTYYSKLKESFASLKEKKCVEFAV